MCRKKKTINQIDAFEGPRKRAVDILVRVLEDASASELSIETSNGGTTFTDVIRAHVDHVVRGKAIDR